MKRNQIIIIIFIFISILPILIMRDFTPDNELKYLSIADEAIEQGHIVAFYNHGVAYADKPPLYFWAVMLGKLIFGKHVMLFISMLSVIPALIIFAVMNRWTSKYYLNKPISNFGISGQAEYDKNCNITAMLLLGTTAFFLACMLVLRMDMLMTMFITLSLYTFFRMYTIAKQGSLGVNSIQQCNYRFFTKYRRLQIALPIYIFLAIFSKGAIGFILPILVIIIFLLIKGDIKDIGKYLGWRMWVVLASLCAIWFGAVYLDGGEDYLNNLLFNQTVNRAVNAFHHKKAFYYYGISFWYAAAPWALLSIVTLITAYIKGEIKSDVEKFYATVFFTTIIMLSCISSKLEVYLLPCFPFIIYLTAILLHKLKPNFFIKAAIAIPAIVLISIFTLSLFVTSNGETMQVAIPFLNINESVPVKLWAPAQVFTSVLFIGGILSLIFIFKNKTGHSIAAAGISLLLTIFIASLSMPQINKLIGAKNMCLCAKQVAEQYGIDNYSIYSIKVGQNFDVYFKEMMHNDGKSTAEISALEINKKSEKDLQSLNNTLLIVETKDASKDTLLRRAIAGYKIISSGKYSIIPINDKGKCKY